MENKKEIIDFAQWYSGMERSKVINAYNRYLKEIKSINSDEPDEVRAVGKHEAKKKVCYNCGEERELSRKGLCYKCSVIIYG